MPNFFKLDFFSYPLRDNFQLPELTDENFNRQQWYLWHYANDENFEVVNDDIINWCRDRGLRINHCHIFCGPPEFSGIIHSDGEIGTYQFAINWVLSGFDSYMIWYDSLIENLDTKTNFTKSFYRQWHDDQVKEIERCKITGPTLINASVPHRVVNNSNEHRWTFSLRFEPETFTNWKDTVKFFQPYIII